MKVGKNTQSEIISTTEAVLLQVELNKWLQSNKGAEILTIQYAQSKNEYNNRYSVLIVFESL